MSATTMISSAAKTPYSEAASLEHYNRKTLEELKVLAKLHGISDAGESQDIVALLMESDRKNKAWPGMHHTHTDVVEMEQNGEGAQAETVKQAWSDDEMSPETLVTALGKEKSKDASTATVSNKSRAVTPMAVLTAKGSKNDTAIPIHQLAEEWDKQWGPPYAFAEATTIDTESQGTSTTSAESTPTRSKSPASPVSPISPMSPVFAITPPSSALSKLNLYNVLIAEDEEDDKAIEKVVEAVVEEVPRIEEAMKKAPSVQENLVEVSTIKEEEKVTLDNNDVDAGEKTKKKKKRGKKGGKKVNKAKTDTTEASAPNTAAPREEVGVQLVVSPAKPELTGAPIEPTIDVPGPIPIVEECNGTIVEPSPSVALTQMDESVEEQTDLVESKPTEDVQKASSSAQTPAPEQTTASSLAAPPSEPTVKPLNMAPVQIFPAVAALQPSSTQPAPPSTPAKTRNQRRNEKRKENKQTIPSNMYNALVSVQSAETPAPDSSNTKENDNSNSGEAAAPVAKKNKRGAKGGKKAQAQKKNKSVPVVETTVTSIVQAAVAGKTELVHVGLAVAMVILAGAVGAWAKG